MYTQDKPYIFDYENGEYVQDPNTPYYTWGRGTVWIRQEAAIKFMNDTGQRMKIGSVSIKSVACDSGGRSYWAANGRVTTPCVGYGAQYTVYVRVSNDGEATFQESSKYTNDVANISGTNMNTPGTSRTNCAQFGNPPFTGDKALQLRDYTIEQCPIIEPNGVAYVHFSVHDFHGPYTQTVIRFVLNPLEMNVTFEPELGPYIWQYQSDNQWHLVRPIQIRTAGKWMNVEGE